MKFRMLVVSVMCVSLIATTPKPHTYKFFPKWGWGNIRAEHRILLSVTVFAASAILLMYALARLVTPEVSPVGSVYEIRTRPDEPSCHVCGAQMVVNQWSCLSCGTTTGVREVSATRSSNILAPKTAEEAQIFKENNIKLYEQLEKAEVETRELKAALRKLWKHIEWVRDHGKLRIEQTQDQPESNVFNQGVIEAAESILRFAEKKLEFERVIGLKGASPK